MSSHFMVFLSNEAIKAAQILIVIYFNEGFKSVHECSVFSVQYSSNKQHILR